MKVQPVSADMLIKLGIGAVIIGGVAMIIYTAKSKASAAAGWAANHLDPNNPSNVAYSTINKWGGQLVEDPYGAGKNKDGSWSLGGWLYDVTHPDTVDKINKATEPTIGSKPFGSGDGAAKFIGADQSPGLGAGGQVSTWTDATQIQPAGPGLGAGGQVSTWTDATQIQPAGPGLGAGGQVSTWPDGKAPQEWSGPGLGAGGQVSTWIH